MRAKRRRPLLAADVPAGQDDLENEEITMEEDVDRGDDVDEFISERHSQMTKAYDLHQPDDDDDDDEDEEEMRNVNVLDLDASDSENSDSDLLDDEDEEETHEDEEKDDRGGSRKNWYGGDTHQYEIMEDAEREELLLDEEEEAIRLQKRALRRALLEDYGEDDDNDSGDDTENDDEDQEAGALLPEVNKGESVKELELLADEFRRSLNQLSHLKDKILMNEPNRIMHQLLSLFITNVALYFSLRTDPDSTGVNLRSHPVLHRIVQIRSFLQKANTLPVEKDTVQATLDPAGKTAELDIENDGEMKPTRDETMEPSENGDERPLENGNMGEHDTEIVSHSGNMTNKLVRKENGVEPPASQEAAKLRAKRTKKQNRKRSKTNVNLTIAADEERVMSMLQAGKRPSPAEEEAPQEQKRKKLNKMVGAMERERKNDEKKRMVSADLDHIREEAENVKRRGAEKVNALREEAGQDGSVDDEDVMRKLLAKREKKESRKARKAAESKPHVYTFNDEIHHSDGKRKASSQVVKNRGLTRYRPREKKTPRTRNRLSYQKAVVRRKGAVRDYAGTRQANYGGEASGINMSARKSSML